MYILNGDWMKVFKIFIILLIISFLGLFFAYSNGYYEKMQGDKMILTNKMIEEFEKDVLNGENVTIESYLKEEKDYSTNTSKVSLKISSKIENIVDSGIKFVFRRLGNMIE